MKFDWDDQKNIKNYRKHGVWFEEAKTIWADEGSEEFFDPEHSKDEDRYIRVGYSISQRVLLVVFCERNFGNIIRIISARKAKNIERMQHGK